MPDYSNSGAFNVNGQWVTSLRYDAELNSGTLRSVSVSFRNGRQEVAKAQLEREEALELLGPRNVKAMELAAGEQSAGSREKIKGELRGRRLEFRQVNLTDEASRKPGNTIALDSRQAEPVSARHMATEGAGATAASPAERPPAAPIYKSQSGLSFPMPEEIERRFLRIDHKYYFPDRSLAFIDQGTKLKIETDNAEVVKLALDIAQARGWPGIRVTGTDEFRSKVWREASLRDIHVSGYEPTELERQDAERTRNRRAASKVSEPSPVTPSSPVAASAGERPKGTSRIIAGKLVAHGAAYYKNDRNQPMSYYVTVASDTATRTLWGVGLEKAIRESLTQPKIGERVGVQHVGSETVRVTVPVKDENGAVTGERAIDMRRNRWVVEKIAYFGPRQADRPAGDTTAETATRLKAAAATQDNQPDAKPRAQAPQSVASLAIGRVAELFAERHLNERDRLRFVETVNRQVAERDTKGERPIELRVRGESRTPTNDMARG